MSLENEDRSSPDKAFETSRQAQKQSKILYSREFLLSLSGLEISKKLPGGFDVSILSEFEDASHGIQDRQRVPGSSPLQGYRRSEYSASPPTRGDSGTYSRNTYGRWDSRSSGRSDRDSDSQSDLDSDSGQRHGNPSRQSWQSSEHDGLLGSGSFPRPSGYASGISAPKARENDPNHLNRSNEPYHPPRPYKAVPHSRRDAKDSLNDETFGSSESTSQDRVEEERRRRASFELMRKEQQKALQEKQKLNQEKQKVDVSDISVLLDDTKEEKSLYGGSDVLDVSATPAVSTDNSSKSTILSQTSTSRPLVPPGFATTILEKNPGLKSLTHTHKTELGKPELEESLLHVQPKPIRNGTLDSLERQSSQDTTFCDHHLKAKSMRAPYMEEGEKIMSFPLSLEVSDSKLGEEDHLIRTSSLSETHESVPDPEVIEISAKRSGSKIQGEFNQNNSTLILEKIFGSALAMNASGSTGPVEQIQSKPDDTWTPNSVQSSKFAQWFSEEERKPRDDLSYDRPKDLLSLIVSGDKGRSQLSQENATEHFPSESSHESSELATKLMSSLSSTENGVPERLYDSRRTEATPTVLTCEDLEQTILSEYGSNPSPDPAHSGNFVHRAALYSEKSSNLQRPLQGLSVAGVKSEQPRRQVDNHASQHLLLLLQKGTSPNQMASSPCEEVDSDKILVSEARDIHAAHEEPREEDVKSIHTSEKTLTLETLFGSAFMNELQSVEAPVSVQRGSVGSSETNVLEPLGSLSLMNNGLLSSTSNEAGPYRTSYQNDILPLNQRQKNKLEKTANWLGFDDPRMELNLSKHQTEVNSKHGGINETVEFQLPDEEGLIGVGDPLNPQNSMFMPAGTLSKGRLSSHAPTDIAGKLAAIGAVVKEERYPVGAEGSPFVLGPYGRIEPEILHHNLHAQASSPQSHAPQTSHGRPLFYSLDSHPTHMNSQMKFMAPESMIHHDLPSNHQYPTNMIRPHFPRQSAGVTAYDLPAHNTVLPQMQIPGNYPPHPLHEIQRSTSFPHPANQATALMPELNPMQGFPLGPRQPNIGSLGMPMPAPDINSGSNHSEAFQRLLEMELRAKSKQVHPLSRGHSQAMYGHELDMGFRYR